MPRRPSQKEGPLQTSKRHWDPPYSFSVFGTSKGRFWHVDGHWGQPYSFSVFLEVEGAILARRRTLGPALQFFCFWHVEGTILARRRTLGPALQFFCFLFFSRSKEQFWHVDGHWDQPYSFSVFLFLARRRGAFGTSTGIGTMPYSFSVFCFSKEHCWHVDVTNGFLHLAIFRVDFYHVTRCLWWTFPGLVALVISEYW